LAVSLWRALANVAMVTALLFLLEAWDGPGPLAAALALAAGLIAVFGIAIPHAWAEHGGLAVLRVTGGVLQACRYAMYPVTALMGSFELPVRRLLGVPESSAAEGETARQEIVHAAEEGQAEGAVDAEEVEMIESVIEFRARCADEIMTPRTDMFALPVETPWHQACHQVFEAGHTRVPVYDGDLDNIIGILYAKDLLRHIESDEPAALRQIMRKPYFVPETKPLADLLREFKRRKVHLAVVLDEYGGTAGLVSIEDVLEEIVGDIADEYDQAEPALMRRLDERSAEVDGRMYVDDLNDALGLHLPEDEDYDTVAGLVFSEIGYVPTVDETIETHGARFTILAADQRKITRLRVDVLQPAEPEPKE
jgi:CBS domain containing-hemolysin-like protein